MMQREKTDLSVERSASDAKRKTDLSVERSASDAKRKNRLSVERSASTLVLMKNRKFKNKEVNFSNLEIMNCYDEFAMFIRFLD